MFICRPAMQFQPLVRQSMLRKFFVRTPANSSNVASAQIEFVKRDICTANPLCESFKVQDPKDFERKVMGSDVPVIVDFFATWCNPCRTLAPRLESVIAEKKGQVKLAKVDIDENTDLALEYEVASVPVLLAIRNGKEEMRLVGLQDKDKLEAFVNKVLKKE
ncbi:thioredoxin, mitochondrial [Ischnura elegans]|uniref:thioredoxin, mitochondrial n=1 Tax=Ischnura elegans TaxID=197161 RepID=UPI001ED8BE58|nr:thioredoxin, mitochondrial [Ischnura elegans]